MSRRRISDMRPKVIITPRDAAEDSREWWIIAATYDGEKETITLCGPGRFLRAALDLGRGIRPAASVDFVDEGRHFRARVSEVTFAVWMGWTRRLGETCRVRFVRRLGRLCG